MRTFGVYLQVYASYEYRHDFAEAMKPGTWKQAPAKTLPYDFHDDVYVDSVPVCAPEMRKSLAWELILRNIHRTEVSNLLSFPYDLNLATLIFYLVYIVQTKRATDKLIEEFKTNDIRDVSVMIKPLKRHAELVYIPVFAIQFSYGETFNVHGERCKQFFNGLISASRELCVLITCILI